MRDRYTCQLCWKKWKKGQRRLDVHHIFGDPEDTKKVRGNTKEQITLCHKCHFAADSWKMAGNGRKVNVNAI